jgi:twitching motility protein PilT
VLPLSRPYKEPAIATVSGAPVSAPDLERLLRIAAARGASGLYLVAQSHPVVRVDGEMQQLDSEESLTPADVEAFMLALAPEPSREAVRTGATSEWFRDVPDLGRIRCLSFRDHRGPGVILRMLPARAISVEQLGLSKEIQALCGQAEGLVLVAGPRASGTSTLIAAFVDLVNRSRTDHVIAIERQIAFVHENRRSFVSQREVRGDADELAFAVRTALREDPDVLVVEELRTAEMIASAVEAAESGRLVFAGLRAPATVPALERLVEQFQPERRPHILTSLAASLRGVVGQVLLRKRGGGRVAARELLLNTPAAAAIIAEGKLFQLPAALESGRKLGCVALNDALSALIRDGVVDPGEAWRKAYDRDGLLTALKREGIDTSFVERLA